MGKNTINLFGWLLPSLKSTGGNKRENLKHRFNQGTGVFQSVSNGYSENKRGVP